MAGKIIKGACILVASGCHMWVYLTYGTEAALVCALYGAAGIVYGSIE